MPNRAITLSLAGLLLLGGSTGWAQSAWEVLGQVGMLATRTSTRATNQYPLVGLELNWLRHTNGEKLWQRAHGLPKMGLSFTARNVGNPTQYGYDASLVPFLEFAILRKSGSTLHVRHGTGLAYITRPYAPDRHPTNELLSTHLNAASFVKVGMETRLGKYLRAVYGVDLRHLSNGNLFRPNLGLNTLSLYAGVQWSSGPEQSTLPALLDRRRRRWGWSPGLALGVSQQKNTDRHQFDAQLSTLAVFQHDVRFRALGGRGGTLAAGGVAAVGPVAGRRGTFWALGGKIPVGCSGL